MIHLSRAGRITLLVVGAMAMLLTLVTTAPSSSASSLHGITFLKGCQSPTNVGEKTRCNFTIANSIDPDTLTITNIKDVVHAAGGDDVANNILDQLQFTATGNASCDTGQNVCTLPPGGKLQTSTPFAFHTVTGGDVANKNPLQDDATLTWQDTCSSHADNCPTGNQSATTGSATLLQKLPSATTTTIHNNAHDAVTAVGAGTPVHDFVSVDGGAGNPTPSGTVKVDWFTNSDCSGSPASSSANTALNGNGNADVTSFKKTPAAGQFGFLAHYSGDNNYQPSDGTCEPLVVVDAAITVAPSATNEVGHQHTFTVTVTKNDGTGWTPAAGQQITYTLDDSNGATHVVQPNPPTTCDGTTNGNGKCNIVINSSTAGKVTANASVTMTLAGVTITRDTDPATAPGSGPGGSGPKVKTYVDASIAIAPSDASNEVGVNHVFTVTAKQNAGDGSGFVAVPDGTKPNVTLTNANGANAQVISDNCASTGTVNGQCTVTFVSSTAGRVTGNAAMTIVVGGVTMKRSTNPASTNPSGPGGSGPAKKFYVDANISIGPDGTNPVGAPHTFTVTVQQNSGNGAGFVGVPDGTPVTVTLTDQNGANSSVIENTCPQGTVNSTCHIKFTSATEGTTIGNASTTVVVRGVTLNRSTSGNHGPGGTGPATKNWINSVCNLGYPDSSNPPRSQVIFNESEVLRSFQVLGTGANQHVVAWYNDEHALTLGVRQVVTKTAQGTTTQNFPFTPMTQNPDHAVDPLTGANINQGGVDYAAGGGRPIFPAVFVTDITNDTTSRSGDWQQGSNNGLAPSEIFGTWKGAVRTVDQTKNPTVDTITPDSDPAKNNWNLGPGADPVPAGLTNQGYGAEVIWRASDLGLQPGHFYRLVFMVHDGDQNKTGGDVGEACANIFIPQS